MRSLREKWRASVPNKHFPLRATLGERQDPSPTLSLAPSVGEGGPQAAAHVVSALLPTCQVDEMLTWAQPPLARAATSRFVFKEDWLCLGNGCWRILRQNSQRPESESSFLGHAAQGFRQPPHQPPELGHWPRGWCSCFRAAEGRKLPPGAWALSCTLLKILCSPAGWVRS